MVRQGTWIEVHVTGTFSADAPKVNAAAAEGGKVKFTVTPRGEDSAKVAVYHLCVFLI